MIARAYRARYKLHDFMSMFRLGVFLRHLLTASGTFATLMLLLEPEWQISLLSGQTMRPRVWLWQEPDLSLVAAVSSQINWMATLGLAAAGAICTYAWWRVTGRLQSAEAAQCGAARA